MSDENVKKLAAHLEFDSMESWLILKVIKLVFIFKIIFSENPMTNMSKYMELLNHLDGTNQRTNMFIRKGVVGGHKDEILKLKRVHKEI